MNEENGDKRFDALVRRALVPKGYRPQSNDQIERMLGAIGGVPIETEKLERMLSKLNQAQPPSPAPKGTLPYSPPTKSEERESMRALHKAQGKSMPPHVRAKIQEIEKKAALPPEKDGDGRGR